MIRKNNLAKLLTRFENKWVALSSDYKRVLLSGDSLPELEKKVSKKQLFTAVYFKVPPMKAYFVPHDL